MYRYSLYIARQLAHSILLLTFSLTSIIWLTQALRFIDFIVNQGVSIGVFLKLTVLLIPSLLLMILPPAMLAAVVFVYHKLKSDSELVVMQAMGLSKWRLASPALMVALLVTLAGYSISFYLQPVSYRQFKDMQSFLRNNYASILLQEGVFSNPVDGLTIFIRERDKDNILHGILVHDNRQKDTQVTMMAEEGSLVETPQGPRFVLKNGQRQENNKGKLSFLSFESHPVDIGFYAKNMGARAADPQEMFVPQLFVYDSSVSETENKKRVAEAHQRMVWPIYSFALAMVALAVMLSGQFSRRGQWHRITLCIGLGTMILFAAIGFRGTATAYPMLTPLLYINALVPMLVAAWGLSDRGAASYRRPLFVKGS
jgi:lipopolysaccharide export system permease protein